MNPPHAMAPLGMREYKGGAPHPISQSSCCQCHPQCSPLGGQQRHRSDKINPILIPISRATKNLGCRGGSQPVPQTASPWTGGEITLDMFPPLFSPPFQVIAGKLNRIQRVFPFQNVLERRSLNPFGAHSALQRRKGVFRGVLGPSRGFAGEQGTARFPPQAQRIPKSPQITEPRSSVTSRGRFGGGRGVRPGLPLHFGRSILIWF